MSVKHPETPARKPLTEAQAEELARRRAEGLRDLTVMISWSIVREELRNKA